MSMKKSIIMVVVAVASVCFSATTYDLANGNVSVPANTTATITQSNSGTATSNTITIGSGATVTLTGINIKGGYINGTYVTISSGATVTFNGVKVQSTNSGPTTLNCNGTVTIILADGSNNTITSASYKSAIIGSGTLTIKGGASGTGKLTVTSSLGGAIYNSGSIVIEGGNIIASTTATEHYAAIGDGFNASSNTDAQGGSITIKGGSVKATSKNGPGIGGWCGNITISGGTVVADGGSFGAGIGNSYYSGGACGNITIRGGTVTATGGGRAAGIGCGYVGKCGSIIISGGTITATGSGASAGIGAGDGKSSCGQITVSNSVAKVVATKGSSDVLNYIGKSVSDSSAGTVTIGSKLQKSYSNNNLTLTLTPTYTITWKNYDGTTLKTDTGVLRGATPSYSGTTPTRASTAQYSYSFKGWSPTVVAATADKTYTATFTETVRKYTVTWKDEDGSTLKTESVAYGTTPDYGEPPTKESSGVVAYAFAGWTPDVVAVSGAATYTATYVRLNPEDPVILPESGTIFDSSLTVSMSCPTDGATIYYTTNGVDPTVESTAYQRFRIYRKTTVKAVAEKNGLLSEVATAEYALGRCGDPVMSLADGAEFAHSNQVVTIRWRGGNDVGALRYTLDGSDPTDESPVYEGPIVINDSTVIKAKVFSDSYFDSNITTASLVRVWENVATPVIDAPASYTGSKAKVVISCATKGATIRYTLNGSEPNSHSAKYTGPIYVTESCTVKAYAVMVDYLNSSVATQTIEKVWGIGDALGKPDHGFTTDGDGGAGWVKVVDATAPNGEAMKSGAIGNSQTSVLETKIMGPGTLTFSWRTSCEEDPDSLYEWDHVELAVDGAVLLRRDGITSWKEETVEITSDGEHTVAWTYKKDDVEADGEDAAWVAGYGWVTDYTETQTTEVPIPYAWLLQHDPEIVDEFDAYEAAAKAPSGKKDYAGNPLQVWHDYVAGTDPTNLASRFIAKIEMVDGAPVVTWEPDLNTNGVIRIYKVYGKETLDGGGEWQYPTNSLHRFFKVTVDMP
ncbi:MAG: chitobiase/beta-hexosaminidase C-terminal domain-containing protein [Kiritimatiellae bacterium]|nr:chitobiase/beta-hexosaminidase C-terminal domain-containing protein [Kiritimatiellia bacterium]